MGFIVRQVQVPVLPTGSPGLRILHFSDIHLAPRQKEAVKFIRGWRELDPDLVISTGDHISHPASIGILIDALGPLLEIPGFFVFGSNDYYGPKFKNPIRYLLPDNGRRIHGPELPTSELAAGQSKGGWVNLTQKKMNVEIKGLSIELRGTDDAHLNRDNYDEISDPRPEVDLALGVTHAPYKRVLDRMSQDSLDLVLSGHTHGGQVRIPWFGGTRSLTTNCDLPNWRSRGLTRVDGEPWLHVSAGMGHNPYLPIRLFCEREVTLLTLSPIAKGDK